MQTLIPSTTAARDAVITSAPERASLPATGFVRQKLLLRVIPFSKTTLWRRVQAGDFPKPVRLSEGITAWRVEDLQQWMQRCGD